MMQDSWFENNKEAELLGRLQECSHVPRLVEVFHSHLQTILITEYLTGLKLSLLFLADPGEARGCSTNTSVSD